MYNPVLTLFILIVKILLAVTFVGCHMSISIEIWSIRLHVWLVLSGTPTISHSRFTTWMISFSFPPPPTFGHASLVLIQILDILKSLAGSYGRCL